MVAYQTILAVRKATNDVFARVWVLLEGVAFDRYFDVY
jgi:hypothetical protein